MALVVGLRTEVVHRYVFELRYDLGHVYWDRAGRIAREILGLEGWDFEQLDVNHCNLSRREMNLSFNFGPGKLDLAQTQSAEVAQLMPPVEFGTIGEQLAAIVTRHLEVESFPRMGFRVWHLYPAADMDESYRFVQDLKMFGFAPEIMQQLGSLSELSHRLVVERQRHMLRIAVAPFEQAVRLPPSLVRAAQSKAKEHRHNKRALVDKWKAERTIKSYPQFGLLLDLDAYIDDVPYPDDLSISDFVASAVDDFAGIKPIVLTSKM